MAFSKCPSCSNQSFEAKELKVRNYNYMLVSIQCSSCGAVVGVLDWENIGAETHIIKRWLKKIGNTVGAYLD